LGGQDFVFPGYIFIIFKGEEGVRTLLTGATGFVGSFLFNLSDSFDCVVRENKRHDFKSVFIISNLDKCTVWDGAFENVDCIIHLAGLAHSNNCSNQDYQSINSEGTLHLALEAAKAGVKRFVFVSSIGVNGTSTTNNKFSNISKPDPHNYYALSKYSAEIGLKNIAEMTGIEVVIIRPTLVYGPKAPGNFGRLTRFITKFPFLPFGLTNNKRDFISVQNLADLLFVCSNHPNAAGHTFLASESQTVSIKDFTIAMAKGLEVSLIQLPVPVGLMRFAGRIFGKSLMVEQLVGDLQVDSSNLKEVLNWVPPYTMKESMAFLKDKN